MNQRRPGNSITGVGPCPICHDDNLALDKRIGDILNCAACGSAIKLVESEITPEGIKIHFSFVRTFSGYGRCPNCRKMLNLVEIVGDKSVTCDTCGIQLVLLVHLGEPSCGVLTLGRIHPLS